MYWQVNSKNKLHLNYKIFIFLSFLKTYVSNALILNKSINE